MHQRHAKTIIDSLGDKALKDLVNVQVTLALLGLGSKDLYLREQLLRRLADLTANKPASSNKTTSPPGSDAETTP